MNLSDNVQVETAKHPIGTKYRSHRHRLTLKFLREGAQTIAQAPNRSNTSPDATQGMAHLGFRCGPRGESGTPRRQSNHRDQRNSSHRFGTSPRGAETPRPAAAAGDRASPTSCRATRLDQKAPRGWGCGPGRPRERRRRPRPGGHRAEAAGDQNPRHGRRSLRGTPGVASGARRGSEAFGSRWVEMGSREETGVEPGGRLNRRFSPAPGTPG